MKLPKLTKEIAKEIDNEYKKTLSEADSFNKDELISEPDSHFILCICDGNGAASRGLDRDKFYILETDAPDLRSAINNLEDEIRNIDRFDAYSEDDEDYEDYYDYFNSLDPTGGSIFLAGYIENGKLNLDVYMDDVVKQDFDDPEKAHLFIG